VNLIKMQFPDDVLGIIRAYSRPRMQFVKEYCVGARKIKEHIHGIQYLRPDVKRLLFTEDASKVIAAWTRFTDAIEATNRIRWTHMFDQGKINQVRIQKLRHLLIIQNQEEQELRFLVYGEKRWH